MKTARSITHISAAAVAAAAALTLVVATLAVALPGCKQAKDTAQEPASAPPAAASAKNLNPQPPANQGRERFDLEKLPVSLKPGEPVGWSELPDQVTVGDGHEFRSVRKSGNEATGTGYRTYEFGGYTLSLIAGAQHTAIIKFRAKQPTAEPLEVYPGVWMCQTTREQIIERFGDTWGVAEDAKVDVGYPAAGGAWVEIGYDEATGVVTRFYVQYVGE